MTAQNKKCLGKHLSLVDRKAIEDGIRKRYSKADIARAIGKDKTTVAKEIEKHRSLKTSSFGYTSQCSGFANCRKPDKKSNDCQEGLCMDYKPFYCKYRDRTPGACNGCSAVHRCHYNKYYYYADNADREYKNTLISSRTGVDLTNDEGKAMGELVSKLIKQGQSPYAIISQHPELDISVKTLYNYIDSRAFEFVGILNIDLPRKVGRKMSKKKVCANYKKRVDHKYLIGRSYDDYLAYCNSLRAAEQTDHISGIVQMDTVYNDVTNGPFLQTFKFLDTGFFFALFHEEKTARAMVEGVNTLERILGEELFERYCRIILTDRGTEFSDAEGIEKRKNGSQRTRVFYCDPMQSGQKGSLENKHSLFRRICPKSTDLRALGLTHQEALNLALSHLNSYPLKDLHGKSPFQITDFLFEDLSNAMKNFGIREIPADEVILKSTLLSHFAIK